jgi:hypothetical protein
MALPVLEEHLGADADYYDADGELVGTFPICPGVEESTEQDGDEGRMTKRVRVISLSRAVGLPFWDAAPDLDGFFTFGGARWAIEAVVHASASSARLRLVHLGTIEQTHPHYRRKF